MKWLMLVCGALTGIMLYAVIALDAAVRATFGAPLLSDSIMALIFAVYLIRSRGAGAA